MRWCLLNLFFVGMANFRKNKKVTESAAQAKGLRQQELATSHVDAVDKKSTNMILLVDMRKESLVPLFRALSYLLLLLGLGRSW